jgi:hypothetical protein
VQRTLVLWQPRCEHGDRLVVEEVQAPVHFTVPGLRAYLLKEAQHRTARRGVTPFVPQLVHVVVVAFPLQFIRSPGPAQPKT